MTGCGSYRVESIATSVEAEVRRLNAQVDLFWAAECGLLQRYGLQDGMDVLDCGCGPGRMIELLKGQMPALRCVGLEMDPLLVSVADRLMTERGLSECRIVQGTAEQPELAEGSFDFIVLRLVLEHVPHPGQALKSLGRLLRSGGRLVVIANDFEFHLQTWPPVPQFDRLYEAYRASRRQEGGDPCIGRRLPQLLALAGLAVVGCEIEVAHNALLGDGPFLRAEGAGIPAQLVRTGFLDGRVLEEMTREWQAMLAEPGHSIVRLLFAGVGERPREGVAGEAAAPIREESALEKQGRSEQKALNCHSMAESGGSLAITLALAAEVLRKTVVQPQDRLADLGMDSLTAMTMQESLRKRTGVEISIVKLLENMSVAELAHQIDTEQKRLPLPPEVASEGAPSSKAAEQWVEGEI